MHNIVLKDIVVQYAEEAAFLWILRDRAVHAPHYRVGDLSALDKRIEAHLDGIHTAGEAGWEICKESLACMEPGEVFTAGVIAFEENDDKKIQSALEAGIVSIEPGRGIVSALGWLPYAIAEKHIKNLLTAGQPELRRIGIAASAIHGHDPGLHLTEAISDVDILLRMEALRATGRLGRVDMLSFLKHEQDSSHGGCRFWAAWSGAVFRDIDSIEILKEIAESDSFYSEKAVKMASICMDRQSLRRWHEELANMPVPERLAIICAGMSGDVLFIPWLIEKMQTSELARLAGESFTMITGVDIANGRFEGKKPEGFETGPDDNPENEDIELDPDENLPWPDCQSILLWWNKNEDSFLEEVRYLLGRPLSEEWLGKVLRSGRQRERGVAALGLAILHPGMPLFEIRAPGFRQEQLLM